MSLIYWHWAMTGMADETTLSGEPSGVFPVDFITVYRVTVRLGATHVVNDRRCGRERPLQERLPAEGGGLT